MTGHISINVRYLLWRKGVPRNDWDSWLARHTTIGPRGARSLVAGELADAQINDAKVHELGDALELGDEADNLRYPSFTLGGCSILRENLWFLFGSLGHGGKKALAAELRVDPTTVSRWLKGSYEPQPSTLQQLISYFGLQPGTNLREDPIFLSAEPVAMTQRRSWLHARLDALPLNELRDLYPALRRLLGER